MGISEIQLPVDVAAAAAARSWLADVLTAQPAELVERARLMVSELATNVVRHAGQGERDRLTVTADVDPKRVHVRVCDDGPGFQPDPTPPSAGQLGGWGLVVVDQLSDGWGVSLDGRCCVWFEIARGA